MKQLFHIEAGEGGESVQSVLSIRLGERHCCFSVTDFMSKEVRSLAYYTSEEVNDIFLQELFTSHPELNANFYQVLVCYDYPQSSLVSFKDYQQGNGGNLMNILYGVNSTATIVAEPLAAWQVYNVYAVPKTVQETISKKFTTAKYWHQYTIGIKHVQPATEGGSLLIDLRKDDFTVLAAANNNLLLTQTFSYSTPEDVLYYLLKICQQFGLSQQEVHIKLSGLVDQQSALYRELYQYFLQIEFRNTSWVVPASVANENPLHFFTSLNDLSQCAS